jgi:hypothetical protein
MASSRRPRSSTTSLAPRSLRTFRALARVRGAFPLIDVPTSVATPHLTSLRLVLVGSPEATPAALRPSLRARQAALSSIFPSIATVKLQFVPGAGSLGRRVFRSRPLSERRALLQGGGAILQISVSRSATEFSGPQVTRLIAEATRPFPGFNPVAYLLALPAAQSVRSTSVYIQRIERTSRATVVVDSDPYVRIAARVSGLLGQGLRLPVNLTTQIATPLIHSIKVPAVKAVSPRTAPALLILGILATLVSKLSMSTPKELPVAGLDGPRVGQQDCKSSP